MKCTILKITFILVVLMQFCMNKICAQQTDLLKLPALTDVSSVPWRDSVYRFSSFQKGKITYTKGFELDHEFDLNYNLYYEKMDFISSAGDTLNITNTREIKAIQLGDKWFYHDYKTGYYEVLLKLPVALAMKKQFVLRHLGFKHAGYHKVEIERGASFSDVRGVVADYDRYYDIHPMYFLIDLKNEVHRASRASILKLFSDYNKDILAYLIEHPVDFESGDDLVALITYCNKFILSEQDVVNDSQDKVTVILKSNQKRPAGYPYRVLYRFPEFQETKITWADKSVSYYPLKMNYDFFSGEMNVINEKGDTVKFRKGLESKILNLDGDIFFHGLEKGYLEILMQGPMSLAVKNSFSLVTDKTLLDKSGYKDQASASLASNKSNVTGHDRLYELTKTYFFINKGYQSYEANKLSIFRLMPRHREKIIAFISENNISFENEKDLKLLVTYCNQLTNSRSN